MANTITLTKGQTSVTLPGPPPGWRAVVERQQVLGRSMDGTVHVYDHGGSSFPARVPVRLLSDAQKAELESFFRETAAGMRESFTYTDAGGADYAARFVEPGLAFAKGAEDLWDVELPMELDAVAG
jgi:hypothetical protein